MGDSLSAAYGMPVDVGWVSLFEQRLREKGYPHRVVNASISGETTRGGLDRLPAALREFHPEIVIVELGANDGLMGQPLRVMMDNLTSMIELSRQTGATPLLVRMRLPPNYGPAMVEKFAAVYDALGQQLKVPLTAFMLENVAGSKEFVQDDGLHPNAAGQPRVLDNLWPAIEPLLNHTASANPSPP
jgi:acyl-CoA thioesterase-1